MTSANTLLKNILGVKNIVVEKFNFCLNSDGVKQLTIEARPKKREANLCPICHKHCAIYDHSNNIRTWRALDFGDLLVYITTKTLRISCPEHGVLVAEVPWAFHKSGFTKNFDITATWMAENLSKQAVADYMRIDWKTVGRCMSRVRDYVEPNPASRLDNLVNIGIDETSYRKGHKYLTVVLNHDTNTVVWASDKHGKEVLAEFFKILTEKQRSSIKTVTGDGARWIDQCIEEYIPNIDRCIDSFHVVEWANAALDFLRKESWREAYQNLKTLKSTVKRKRGRGAKIDNNSIAVHNAEMIATRIKCSTYALGKNPKNLTERQEIILKEIAISNKTLYRGYQLKEKLRLALHMKDPNEVKEELDDFFWKATHSRIPVFRELAYKIRRHETHILNTIKLGMSNARIEATNNKIKLIIRRAYGFHDVKNLIDMIMLVCSNIKIPLTNRSTSLK